MIMINDIYNQSAFETIYSPLLLVDKHNHSSLLGKYCTLMEPYLEVFDYVALILCETCMLPMHTLTLADHISDI